MSGPDSEKVTRLEEQIAELMKRWPKHSQPPAMWDELERLEDELEKARAKTGTSDDGKPGPGRLP